MITWGYTWLLYTMMGNVILQGRRGDSVKLNANYNIVNSMTRNSYRGCGGRGRPLITMPRVQRPLTRKLLVLSLLLFLSNFQLLSSTLLRLRRLGLTLQRNFLTIFTRFYYLPLLLLLGDVNFLLLFRGLSFVFRVLVKGRVFTLIRDLLLWLMNY